MEPNDDLSFRTGADLLPAIVYAFTAAGELAFVNRFFVEYTGWEAADVADDSFVRLIHPDDLERTLEALRRALDGGAHHGVEFRFLRRDGSYRTFSSHTRARRAATGEIVGLYGIALDIEDRVRAQAEVTQSERRLETFLATVPQLVWTADASGTVQWYNDRWYAYTGQTREQAFGWGWQPVIHSDDFPELIAAWSASVATGEPYEAEFRLRRIDGTYRWFLARAFALRDDAGNVVRWFGSNTDVDDSRRAQERVANVLGEIALTTTPSEVAGLAIDSLYQPAGAASLVGGDWHDAFAVAGWRLAISIGDVAGHGVEAAAAAARLRATVAAYAIEESDPAEILERTNRVALARSEPLATCCIAIFDPAAGVVAYATAGHPPPIFATATDAAAAGEVGGLPLGAHDVVGATTHVRRLGAGSRAVFYTDGLTEFSRAPLEGERALVAAIDAMLVERPASPAHWLRERILHAELATDDVAILVVAEPHVARGRNGALVWRFHSSDAATAQRSRREIARRLGEIARPDGEALGDAELIVGELLANTVEHAPGLVVVQLVPDVDALVLEVADSGPGLSAEPSTPAAELSEDGRGLFLIRALAREVSFERAPQGGTLVRVVLPLVPV